MVRLPLAGAIAFLALIFFVAISTNSEGLWILFGLNLLILFIGLAINSNRQTTKNPVQSYADQSVANDGVEQDIDKRIEEMDPEALFQLGLYKAQNPKNDNDLKGAFALIFYASEQGYQPAKEFMITWSKEMEKITNN